MRGIVPCNGISITTGKFEQAPDNIELEYWSVHVRVADFPGLTKIKALRSVLPIIGRALRSEVCCASLRAVFSVSNGAAWRIPLYATLVAIAVLLPLDVGWGDASFLVNLFIVLPFLVLTTAAFLVYVVVQGARSRLRRPIALPLLASLISVWVIAGFLEFYGQTIRDTGRWLIWSREYKAQVLTKPTPPDGHLKYIAWDSWGMFAQDSDEFLVFDPTDSLATPHASDPGIVDGAQGTPFVARRLEKNWYLITYPF